MAMSAGLHGGLDAGIEAIHATVATAVIRRMEMSASAGIDAHDDDAAAAVDLASILEVAGPGPSPATPPTGGSSSPDPSVYANVLALPSDVLDGVVASIGILGQEYRQGVPTSVLLDGVAAEIGSPPSEIPPELIGAGEVEVVTAQQAGVADPSMFSAPVGMAAGSPFWGWIPAAVGQIESLATAIGPAQPDRANIQGPPPAVSTAVLSEEGPYVIGAGFPDDPGPGELTPAAPPVPPGLISLGKLLLRNVNLMYDTYLGYYDATSDPMASRSDGSSPDGLGPIANDMSDTVQGDPSIESAGAGGTSYATAVGRVPALTQAAFTPGEVASSSGEAPDEPVPPAPITAGEIPMDILLSEPALSSQDATTGLQQVAELIPVEDSSLALVATLWSLPSGAPSRAADGDDPAGDREVSVPSSASPPPWAVFVIGLDEAFEQSRDACGKALRDDSRQVHGEAEDAGEGRLEWRCPIIPAPEGRRQPDRAAGDRAIASGEADPNRCVPSRSSEERLAGPSPGHDPGDGQPPTEGAVPLAWAVPGSALIAGWFWARADPAEDGSSFGGVRASTWDVGGRGRWAPPASALGHLLPGGERGEGLRPSRHQAEASDGASPRRMIRTAGVRVSNGRSLSIDPFTRRRRPRGGRSPP